MLLPGASVPFKHSCFSSDLCPHVRLSLAECQRGFSLDDEVCVVHCTYACRVDEWRTGLKIEHSLALSFLSVEKHRQGITMLLVAHRKNTVSDSPSLTCCLLALIIKGWRPLLAEEGGRMVVLKLYIPLGSPNI